MELLARLLELSVLVFAVISMFQAGSGSRLIEILGPLRNIGATVRTLIANFVLVPLLALVVIRLLNPPAPLAIGLFLVASAAGAAFVVKLAAVAEADVALSAAQLLVLLPATIIYMPIVVPIAIPEADVSAAAIARPLVLTMLLPLLLGLLARRLIKPWVVVAQPLLRKLSTGALVVLVVTAVLVNFPGIVSILRTTAIIAAVLLIAGAFGIGYLSGGRTFRRREVHGLATAQRNIGAAAVVATQSLDDPDVVTMVVVTSLVGFAVLFPTAWLLSRLPYAQSVPVEQGRGKR